MAGFVSYSGRTATFTPSSNLAGGTRYVATVTTRARDVAGNALTSNHSWAFTTIAPPVPLAIVPFAAGKAWRYDGLDSTVVCAASTGCSKIRFAGEYLLHTERQETWQGRSAWRVLQYRITDDPGADDFFKVTVHYVSQGDNGLQRWQSTTTGGEWRTILSRQSATFPSGAFLLQDGPAHPASTTTLTASSITVPGGTFNTVRARHDFKETGQNAPRDIFETRIEHYADGTGPVYSDWDYTFDDNDPRGTDIVAKGRIRLTSVAGPTIPAFVAESEPNDTTTQATTLAGFAIAAGGALIADAGAVITDAAVGCAQPCIAPNKNGVKLLQDWYRLEVPASRTVRIDLAFEFYDTGVAKFNDLDLYIFAQSGTDLVYLARSAAEAGLAEGLRGTLGPGVYYLAVQAWDTPGARVPYWLSIR